MGDIGYGGNSGKNESDLSEDALTELGLNGHALSDDGRSERGLSESRFGGEDRLSEAEAERLLAAFGPRSSAPGPAALPDAGISSVAGSASRMSYSAGWESAGDATDSAREPAGIDGPAAPSGVWRPDGQPGSGDTGGGTTVSSVDFLADLGPSADVRAVAEVLSAAAAPPWPQELRGYEAARRAFESAGPVRGARRAGTTPIRNSAGFPLRRLLGVKLAAVAGALTVTGVAVAAEADVLPSPIQRAAHQVLGGVGVPEPDQRPGTGQSLATGPDSSSGPGSSNPASRNSGSQSSAGLLPGTPSGTADPSGRPTSTTADALTLCRAYVAHSGNGNVDGGLSDHDHKLLADLAGGADKIDAYCAQVLAAPTGTPVPQPSGTASAPDTPPSASPDPSRDHKPDTGTSSSPGFDPQTGGTSTGVGNGHTHTPDPSHPGH